MGITVHDALDMIVDLGIALGIDEDDDAGIGWGYLVGAIDRQVGRHEIIDPCLPALLDRCQAALIRLKKPSAN